jgi:hypothetical protein
VSPAAKRSQVLPTGVILQSLPDASKSLENNQFHAITIYCAVIAMLCTPQGVAVPNLQDPANSEVQELSSPEALPGSAASAD